jgi:hypothetical protein
MADTDLLKTARQMIDDLINDDADSAKSNFHDFLTAKTVAKLNPDAVVAASDDEEEVVTDDEDDPSVGAEDFSDDDDEKSESENDEEEVK